MPCTDEEIDLDSKGTASLVTLSNHDHPQGEDPCSPFCVCACCRSQLNQPTYYFFSFRSFGYTEVYLALSPQPGDITPHNIWQPPRV